MVIIVDLNISILVMPMKHTRNSKHAPPTNRLMKQSFKIVSLIILFASASVVHAEEQVSTTAKANESVKHQQAKKPLPFRTYWAAKSWDAGSSDFWHSAKRETISVEKAATTQAALLLKRQQKLRSE